MKKYSTWLAGLLLFYSTSCNDFLDINTSPNDSAEAPVNLVFAAATGSAAYVMGGFYQILGGMWAQHWTQSTGSSQYRDVDSYDLTADSFDARQYGELYSGALKDFEYIRVTAKADGNWSYYLMATVMQSYVYQVLVDLYDNVPFSDALKGDQANLTPKFDSGPAIYDSLIERINVALSKDFSALTVQTPGSDDVIFQGDLDKWVQFANTLKLKIYLRESDVRSAVAQAGIEDLFNEPNFLTEDASFKAFRDELDNRNPVYETGVDRLAGNLTISNTLFTILNDNSDPRRDSIMDYPLDTPEEHLTLVQGDYFADEPVNIRGLSTPNLKPLDYVYFLSAAESYFLQAEAVARYGVPGDAADLYNDGVQASFTRFDVTVPASDYTGEDKVYEFPSAGTFEEQLEAIITQKWIAMANSQSLEAFFEQNRTGFPNSFTVAVNNVTSGDFPKRLTYPQSERLRNPDNVPPVKPLTERVWWDID